MKKCSRCGVEKELIEFHKQKASKDGLKAWCKSCAKQYDLNHKIKIAAQQKQHYLEHKEEIIAQQKQYQVERKVSDPLYKLTKNLRCLIRKSIKNGGYKKSSKTQDLLGANFKTVMKHFKNSWSKRYSTPLSTSFEIHHVIENHTATSEEELIRLQHYTNLIPVSKEEHKELHR